MDQLFEIAIAVSVPMLVITAAFAAVAKAEKAKVRRMGKVVETDSVDRTKLRCAREMWIAATTGKLNAIDASDMHIEVAEQMQLIKRQVGELWHVSVEIAGQRFDVVTSDLIRLYRKNGVCLTEVERTYDNDAQRDALTGGRIDLFTYDEVVYLYANTHYAIAQAVSDWRQRPHTTYHSLGAN